MADDSWYTAPMQQLECNLHLWDRNKIVSFNDPQDPSRRLSGRVQRVTYHGMVGKDIPEFRVQIKGRTGALKGIKMVEHEMRRHDTFKEADDYNKELT